MSPLASLLACVFGPPYLLGVLMPTVRWRVGYAVFLGCLFLLIAIPLRCSESVADDAPAGFVVVLLMTNVLLGGLAGTGAKEMLSRFGSRGNWKWNALVLFGGALISFAISYFVSGVLATTINS